ncbi:MAG: helix-turn-helix transcriptional regulator [Clostridia bacterium]|nr:helix-turn-helix transcriptional regulator [Clostridia bacterium]
MTVGQRIKLYRKDCGLTQSELAELIGVSMQAVSKWETDAGMPDISQIIPLARVLGTSTDMILGYLDDGHLKEAEYIREQLPDINLLTDPAEIADLYVRAKAFFQKHPNVPDIALVCLECVTAQISEKSSRVNRAETLEEIERYGNSVFRYETDADRICKAYCLMSRAYDLLGEGGKAEEMINRVPMIWGDRSYWEAEIAFADGKYDIALHKVKESFAVKARFIARCIRMVTWITGKTETEDVDEHGIALQEYMLRIIEAFLSGGDYLPWRQVHQKSSLHLSLVRRYMKIGDVEHAIDHYERLAALSDRYLAALESGRFGNSLMFEYESDGCCDGKKALEEKLQKARAYLPNEA